MALLPLQPAWRSRGWPRSWPRRTQALVTLAVPLPGSDAWHGAELEALRRQEQARFGLDAATLRLRADVARAHERPQAAVTEVRTLRDEVLPGAQSVFDACD
ncbi:hypothetical protein [Azohydromonas aeria]|uniref:hypothetical protein n=1 Tax=Azohydromonas aeria TaxID=2590212 RepID=UPI0012F84DB1|nr:hypothetical protein [Azohydromonas aeria]